MSATVTRIALRCDMCAKCLPAGRVATRCSDCRDLVADGLTMDAGVWLPDARGVLRWVGGDAA